MSGNAGETATATPATSRTKEGVPTWNGEANSFVSYEESALLWEQALTWEKRYTAGPKLVQELTGAARRLVAGQPAGWVAYRGGVQVLMDHLRNALGKPRVNEVTDLLATYFKGCKRKSHESMNDYVTKKFEAYYRASQALKRVAPHYTPASTTTTYEYPSWSRRSSVESTWTRSGPTEAEAPEERQTAPAEMASEATTTTRAAPPTESWGDAAWRPWQDYWGWQSWQWRPSWQSTWSQDWSSASSNSESYQDSSKRPPSYYHLSFKAGTSSPMPGWIMVSATW